MGRVATHEALAAAASFLNIRVVEDEFRGDLILLPVHLTAYYAEESLAVYENLHPILLHDLVEPARLLYVFQMVRHASAAFVAHTDSNELRRR